MQWLSYNLARRRRAVRRSADRFAVGAADREWRKSLPEGRRHRAHRALRQVLQAAVRWKWIEENPGGAGEEHGAAAGEIDPFESWDEIDAIVAELDERHGAVVVFLAGTGVRPEEAFGAEWRDVDLHAGSSRCGARSRRAG